MVMLLRLLLLLLLCRKCRDRAGQNFLSTFPQSRLSPDTEVLLPRRWAPARAHRLLFISAGDVAHVERLQLLLVQFGSLVDFL